MYVKRNSNRDITAVSSEPMEGFELIGESEIELTMFLDRARKKDSLDFINSDLEMSRVLEDVIDLLIDRQIIRFTDLPAQAQKKLNNRHHLRKRNSNLSLLDDEDGLEI